jgi:hypothetical protein
LLLLLLLLLRLWLWLFFAREGLLYCYSMGSRCWFSVSKCIQTTHRPSRRRSSYHVEVYVHVHTQHGSRITRIGHRSQRFTAREGRDPRG